MTRWRSASMLGGMVDGYRYQFRDDGTEVVFFSGEAYRPTGQKTKEGDEIWRYDPTLTEAKSNAVDLVAPGAEDTASDKGPLIEIWLNKNTCKWELSVDGEVVDTRSDGPNTREEAQAWLSELLDMPVRHVQHDGEK